MDKFNPKDIEALLDKYFDAETSLEEEKMLKAYFRSGEVEPHMESYRPLFAFFDAEKQMQATPTKSFTVEKPHRQIRKWISLAASFLIVFSIYSIARHYQEKEKARRAYEDTMYAFSLISRNLNAGKAEIAKLQVFEQTKDKIFKQEKE